MNLIDVIDIKNFNLNELENFKLEFNNIRNNYCENFKFEIPFMTALIDYIIEFNKFPTQKEFRLKYIKDNLKIINEKYLKSGDKHLLLNALLARLNRSYPSLIRDIHFSILLKLNTKYDIEYSLELDFKKGIDCLIDNKYALKLYTLTQNGLNFRERKNYRRINDDSYIYIDIPLNMNEKTKFGQFYLYDLNDVEYINKYINDLK